MDVSKVGMRAMLVTLARYIPDMTDEQFERLREVVELANEFRKLQRRLEAEEKEGGQ